MTFDEHRTALVTGASRGIGRGVAAALGERGWVVYVTGRTTGDGERTIDATARLVDRMGGTGVPVRVDHSDDEQIAAVVRQVGAERGRLDLLVNNVFKIPDPPVWKGGFWEHPVSIWDDQVGIGLRAHYVAAWHAAPLLFAAAPGSLIVNVSSPGGQAYHFSSSYGAGKAGLDRLTADMALELRATGVAAVALYPGHVATEFAAARWAERPEMKVDDVQTVLLVGRALAALADAPDLEERSGTIQWVEDLAHEFDLVDEHGRRPPRATSRTNRAGGRPVPAAHR